VCDSLVLGQNGQTGSTYFIPQWWGKTDKKVVCDSSVMGQNGQTKLFGFSGSPHVPTHE